LNTRVDEMSFWEGGCPSVVLLCSLLSLNGWEYETQLTHLHVHSGINWLLLILWLAEWRNLRRSVSPA